MCRRVSFNFKYCTAIRTSPRPQQGGSHLPHRAEAAPGPQGPLRGDRGGEPPGGHPDARVREVARCGATPAIMFV